MDLCKEEEELMKSMHSSIASALWESAGATSGLARPEEEPFVGEFLIHKKRITDAILSPRCLIYCFGDNSHPFGSLNLHDPSKLFLWPSILFTEFGLSNSIFALLRGFNPKPTRPLLLADIRKCSNFEREREMD